MRSIVFLVGGPDENVYGMLASGIHESSDGTAVNDVNAATLQRKSLIGKILDGRREIQLTVEPRFYRVLIGRDDIKWAATISAASTAS
jgi:hypothetical protein